MAGGVATALDPKAALRRGWEALPAAFQLAVAATASYAFARFVLGHQVPLLAITVCLSSLGFVRDARPRRVVETAFGLAIGVALAEVLLLVAGRGVWQVLVALFATLVLARILQASPPVAVAATAQSAIVLLIQLPAGGPWARSIDGFVGGGVALLATALLPRDPRHAAQRDADRVFSGLRSALDDLARALRTGRAATAAESLIALRALDAALADWRTTLDSAIAVARISPFLHRRLPELLAQKRMQEGVELAIRSLRTIARRVDAMLVDGAPRPELTDLVRAIGAASALLGRGVRDPRAFSTAGQDLLVIARRLDPRTLTPGAGISESMVPVLVRPVVVDLALAAGVPRAEVRAALPDLT